MDTPSGKFKLLSITQLKELPEPEWLIQDLVVAKSFAVLYGPPNTGKSFLALDFALSVGSNHIGIAEPMVHGQVVYVAAEGAGGLSLRVSAWEKLHDCEARNVHFLPEAVNMIETADIADLLIALRTLPSAPHLIVVDTMARCLTGGDENSSKDIGQFVSKMDMLRKAFDCAVIIVHHSTKAGTAVERGSSALRGAADTMLFLSDDSRGLILSCEKQKDAAPFQAQFMKLTIVEMDGGKTSCVIQKILSQEEKIKLNKHQETLLNSFEPGVIYTLAMLCDWFMHETDTSESTFKRTLKALLDKGLIIKNEAGHYQLATKGEV